MNIPAMMPGTGLAACEQPADEDGDHATKRGIWFVPREADRERVTGYREVSSTSSNDYAREPSTGWN